MSHYVPDFEIDDDYALLSSSSLTRSKKSAMIEEDIMELLWQNGQVVTQSQNQRSMLKKPQTPLPTSTSSPPSKYDRDAVISADHRQSTTREIQQQHLFMQEDEMASWLHYPLNDTNFDDHDDFCGGLLYPPPSSTSAAASTTTALVSETHSRAATQNLEAQPVMLPSVTAAAMRPPVPPPRRAEAVPNFPLFSRHRGRGGIAASEPGPSSNNISNNTNYTPNNFRSQVVVRESTVVDSSVTPAVCCSVSRVSEAAARSSTLGASSGDHGRGTISGGAATNNTANRDTTTTCEVTVTSSPGGSSASASAEPPPPPSPQHHPPVAGGVQAPVPEDRKRKGRDDDSECHSEDAEFQSANAKKQQRGSSSTKRSRAAEVHNLSERRRRDRINEKMKALQELIPRCNKSDKASMLDEAIEYLKSLQLQVQMMSMGCGMVPMMFPGVQQYMSPMGMGLGVGMPMEMGMNRPVLPFPNVLAGASLSTPATAAHLGPRFQMPAFHLPSVPSPDPSRMQGANLRDPILSSVGAQNPNPLRVLTFADPYQQYLGLHQMQIPIAQNQASTNPSNSKPSTSRGVDHQDNNQPEGT